MMCGACHGRGSVMSRALRLHHMLMPTMYEVCGACGGSGAATLSSRSPPALRQFVTGYEHRERCVAALDLDRYKRQGW